MTKKTKLERAVEIRAIIDTELSKPFPRIPEVKYALGLLGPLLVDLAREAEHTEQRLLKLEKVFTE